ncbi:amino acid adenylation domain-containing protein [Streptomyces sp. Tue6028]|uniref:amino acid adenylation domain-containing protein n=1 Tax=Streptomyces sp. Tue6028 TaxID=2036037 RepID=UPI003D736136
MQNTSSDSGIQAYWDTHRCRIENAAQSMRAVLPACSPGHNGTVRRDLDPPLAARFAKVTGGEAVLEWTATAAATALVLRRLGAGDTVVLLSGDPLPVGAPVLVETGADMTFRELLAATRTAVAQSTAHAPVPDPELLDEWTGPASVWVGREGTSAPETAGLRITTGAGWIEASADSIAHGLLEACAVGIVEVLRQGLLDPARTVADTGIVDEKTRHTVLTAFNETRDITGGTPFRDLLLQQAADHPDAVAVHDATSQVTYAELVRYATAIGARLRGLGVGPDDVVALTVPRSAWFVVAAVGILFSSGAYLPVEPSLPEGRREQMLAGVRAVVCAEGAALPEGHGPDLRLDFDELCRSARQSALRPTPENLADLLGPAPAPHDLAYVIFTSGSTGTPKGACLEHHSFLNFLRVRTVDCALRPGSEFPQTAPVSFDISVWQMFAPLTGGATVCVLDDETVKDPAAVSRMIVGHGYEYIELVPTFIAVLLDQWAMEPALREGARATLRGLISTGEVLGVDLARRWNAAMPEVELSNAYGPAECTDDVVQGVVNTDDTATFAPIGRPLPNARIYVLDADLQLVPPGVIGEIFVGGANVGRGYFRRPDLTAAAFMPDPYGVGPGLRMYRTGDLGRWRADGVLECLGRADTQVKLRGRRIELGEISHVLEAHPDVSMAAVELVKDDGVERLVAFAAPTAERRADPDVLTAHLTARLPDYMVPHLLVVLDELPSNQNGKVDRRILRELAREHTTRGTGYVAPRDEIERELCKIWADLLKVGEVGVHDDFYGLGGDSIVSIRVVHEAKRRGIALRPRLVLESRTIAQLAAAVRAAAPQNADAKHCLGENQYSAEADSCTDESQLAGSLRELAPLTPAQADFLRLDVPEPDHWNSSVLFTLPIRLPTEAVERAVQLLADRHTVLRARFERTAEGMRQGRVPEPPPVTVHDLAASDKEEQDAEIHRLATGLHTSLSLVNGPVCRVGLFRCAAGPDRLVLIAHHALLDQYSWDVLTEDLSALLRDGSPDHLPAPSSSFFTWARRLEEEVRRDPDRWSSEHWLSGQWHTSVVVGPDDWGVQRDLKVVTSVLDADWSAHFLDGRAHRHTVTERLTAALGRSVQKWLGRPGGELLVQLGGHGREDLFADLDVSGTVGYFSTAYPFVLPLPGDLNTREHTEEVAARLARIPDNGLGFGLLRSLHPDPEVRRRLDAVPAPAVVFDFLGETRFVDVGAAEGRLDFLGNPTHHHSGEARAASMPRAALLDVRVSVDDGRLHVDWLFSDQAVPTSSVRELAQAYETALRLGDDGTDTPR